MIDSIFAPHSPAAIALVLIDAKISSLEIAKADVRIQAWLNAHGFGTSANRICVVPAESGEIDSVFVNIDPSDMYALSILPMLLPKGDYFIDVMRSSTLNHQHAALGFALGAYQFIRYKKSKRQRVRLVLSEQINQIELKDDVEAVFCVRDLVNTPTEDMGPAHLSEVVAHLAKKFGAELKESIGDELLRDGFAAIHAVGRASHRAPRLIELNWGDDNHPKISLVGKGVCFDTGGLDIKASDGMRNMKKDMGGAAHAIALAARIMAANLSVRLQLLVPAVENAISSNAYRPGEVITTRSGISVEIDNTDAEGRVVLCDALTYAGESKPDLIIDFATLTGAARIALGPDLPPLFCNQEPLAEAILLAAKRVTDPLWRMPLWRPYRSMLDSSIADMANAGPSKHAGCITAALYLERFVADDQAWAHLDTYSWNDSDRPGKPRGGEAQSLRAMFAFLAEKYPTKKN